VTTETQEQKEKQQELERLRKEREQRDEQICKEYELKEYGVVTHERYPSVYRQEKVTVIPVEIEVSREVDEFIKCEILDQYGMTYTTWIQQCFNEMVRQILRPPQATVVFRMWMMYYRDRYT
jgi:hypothetical protein